MAHSRTFQLTKRGMKLRSKINLLVFAIIISILTVVITVCSYLFIQVQFQNAGQKALILAESISSMPEIKQAFEASDPSQIIQPITEETQRKTGAEFIVVANMNLIRYSHPNHSLIGKSMEPDPGDDRDVLSGNASITQATGSLGFSVRGKAPIFDSHDHQIGIVSVGFLVSHVWDTIVSILLRIVLCGIVALAAGLWGAYLLSGHIKKQILHMEPFEIAFLSQEQAAILESIREGIIAVDQEGKITICNQEAKRLMDLHTEDVKGLYIEKIIPNSRLHEVLEEGISHNDQPMIIGNTLIVVNRVPITLNGQVIGAVASFRDKIQLDQIDQRLVDVGRYADDLRSQRHEFMNKLHTISGLIQMEEYDLVRQVIQQVNEESQNVVSFFMGRIRDAAVVGILIGKLHYARERDVALLIDPDSHLSEQPLYREIIVTILGNAVENAIEAISQWQTPEHKKEIRIYINDQSDSIVIKVSDTGPGIDPNLKERVFEDGISTKGPGRGFGLALISKLISNAGGQLSILSSTDGATLEAQLPKKA